MSQCCAPYAAAIERAHYSPKLFDEIGVPATSARDLPSAACCWALELTLLARPDTLRRRRPMNLC
jgi:hypothetical protein